MIDKRVGAMLERMGSKARRPIDQRIYEQWLKQEEERIRSYALYDSQKVAENSYNKERI